MGNLEARTPCVPMKYPFQVLFIRFLENDHIKTIFFSKYKNYKRNFVSCEIKCCQALKEREALILEDLSQKLGKKLIQSNRTEVSKVNIKRK